MRTSTSTHIQQLGHLKAVLTDREEGRGAWEDVHDAWTVLLLGCRGQALPQHDPIQPSSMESAQHWTNLLRSTVHLEVAPMCRRTMSLASSSDQEGDEISLTAQVAFESIVDLTLYAREALKRPKQVSEATAALDCMTAPCPALVESWWRRFRHLARRWVERGTIPSFLRFSLRVLQIAGSWNEQPSSAKPTEGHLFW